MGGAEFGLREAANGYMASRRGYLRARNEQHSGLVPGLFENVRLPERIVIGDAYRRYAAIARQSADYRQRQGAIVRFICGVAVEVYQHSGFSWVPGGVWGFSAGW